MNTTSKLKLKLPTDGDTVTPTTFNSNFQTLENYIMSMAQACSVHTPSALSVTKTNKQVSFGAITKNGPAFALSGGGAKITQSGFVIASININLYQLETDNKVSADVCKNNATFYQYSTELSYGWEATIVQTTMLIPVATNDIITVKVRNDTEARGSLNAPASWMTLWYLKNLN